MKQVIVRILIIVFTLLVAVIAIMIYSLKNVEVKMEKQYSKIVVNKNELADYHVFLSPSGSYIALNQIDPIIRTEIANYMKKNNLKLKVGEQQFKRTTSTFEKYITNDFKFEQIEDGKRSDG